MAKSLRFWISAIFVLSVYVQSLWSTASCPIGFYYVNSTRIGTVCVKIQRNVTFYEKQSKCRGNMVPLNFFQMPEFTARKPDGEFWIDYIRTYEEGPYVNWLIGDKRIGEPAEFLQTGTGDPDSKCSVVDLKSKTFRFVSCVEQYSRYCVVPIYENSYVVSWECPPGYLSFTAPLPTCLSAPVNRALSARRVSLRANIFNSKAVCNKSGGFLPNKGYIYSNHPEFISVFKTVGFGKVPLGINKIGRELYWADYSNWTGYTSIGAKIPVADWNFDPPKYPNDLSDDNRTIVSLSDTSWILESDQTIYFNVICEYFVNLPRIFLYLHDTIIDGKKQLQLQIETYDIEILNSIICFTDSEYYYPTKVNVYISNDEYFLDVIEDGNYWCLVNNTLEYTSETSEKVLFVKSESILENRFAVMICFGQQYKIEDINFLDIEDFLNEYFINNKNIYYSNRKIGDFQRLIKQMKIKRTYMSNKQILLHVDLFHVNKTDSYFYDNAIVSFQMTDHNLSKYGIVYVRNVAHCHGNEIRDIDLHEYHNKVYPLDTRIHKGNCTSYVCSGSFDTGYYWELEVQDNIECIREFSVAVDSLTTENQFGCKNVEETTTETTTTTESTADTTTPLITTTTMSPEEKVTEVENQLKDLANSTTVSPEQLTNVTNNINDMLNMNNNNVHIPKSILTDLDTVVKKLEIPANANEVKIVQPNVAIVVGERSGSNPVLGVIVSELTDGFDEDSVHTITEDSSQNNLENNELMVEIPKSSGNPEDRLSFVLFKNDAAFTVNDSSYDQSVNSRVLSITLGQITAFAPGQYVDILLKPYDADLPRNKTKKCAYWDFTLGTNGDWSTQGCDLLPRQKHGLDVCRCKHLTHFAQIIRPNKDFGDVHYGILSIITYVGSFLSLAGLIVIGLTGILFKSWRSDFTNKIWLNLSLSIASMIILFLIISFMDVSKNRSTCLAFGITLHYTLLASFCWMLISAVLSYQRLVRVFSKSSSHRLLKAFLVGWIVPVIPIIILCSVDVDIYDMTQTIGKLDKQFCYPSGIGFWLGLILPIIAIVVANTILFFIIIHSVFLSSKIQRHGDSKQLYRSITVSFLLFFLFGLTWIFALLAENVVIAYLFCITSTMQGFVMFVFFVLGNKKTRDLWCVFLHIKTKRKIPVTSSMSRSASRGISSNGKITSLKHNDYKSNMPKFLTGNFEDGDSRFS